MECVACVKEFVWEEGSKGVALAFIPLAKHHFGDVSVSGLFFISSIRLISRATLTLCVCVCMCVLYVTWVVIDAMLGLTGGLLSNMGANMAVDKEHCLSQWLSFFPFPSISWPNWALWIPSSWGCLHTAISTWQGRKKLCTPLSWKARGTFILQGDLTVFIFITVWLHNFATEIFQSTCNNTHGDKVAEEYRGWLAIHKVATQSAYSNTGFSKISEYEFFEISCDNFASSLLLVTVMKTKGTSLTLHDDRCDTFP